jgi:heme-degrading monooxygenase HmoA
MKTQRITIQAGERAEFLVRYPQPGQLDGKNTRGYVQFHVVGPASVSMTSTGMTTSWWKQKVRRFASRAVSVWHRLLVGESQ